MKTAPKNLYPPKNLHPRWEEAPLAPDRRYIAEPMPTARRHALIWPRCIMGWLVRMNTATVPKVGMISLNRPSAGFCARKPPPEHSEVLQSAIDTD